MTAKPIVQIVGVLLLLTIVVLVRIFKGAKYEVGDLNPKYLREDFGLSAWCLEFEPPATSKKVQVNLKITADGKSHDIAVLQMESFAAQSTNQIFVHLQAKNAVIRFGTITSRGVLPFDISAESVQIYNLGGLGKPAGSNEFILAKAEGKILTVTFQFDE